MIGGIISEQFYHIFSYSSTTVSCIVNVLLIYIIVVTQSKNVGPYRWLLVSFAAMDVCISLSHSVILPIGHLTDHGFICIPLRFIKLPTAIGFWSMLLWVFLFYQTFLLLAFHFVYRFVLLCSPPWLSWIQRRPWRNWITLAIAAEIIYSGSIVMDTHTWMAPSVEGRSEFAPIIKDVYDIDLYAPNLPGFLVVIPWLPGDNGAIDWQMPTIVALLIVAVFVVATVSVIIYCIARIMSSNRAIKDHLQSRTRQLQQQLFRALIWQTIVPCITNYVPVCLLIFTPLLSDTPMGAWGTVALMSGQLFPMIDPFLILIFVPKYRAAFLTRLFNHQFTISSSTDNQPHARNAIVPRTSPS